MQMISRLTLFAILSAGVLATPAFAQTTETNIAPPPERMIVSPGGVDMRSGRYNYNETDLVIGGDTGLSLTRSMAQQVAGHTNPFANMSHNWDILLSEKRILMQEGSYTHAAGNPDWQIEISMGGLADTFRGDAGQTWFEQTSRSGWAQLTYTGDRNGSGAVYTYRSGDGTEAVFRAIGSADCSTALRCAYVSQITRADGTRLTFEYDSLGTNQSRLRSITSNRGYAMLFEYSGLLVTKACVINMTVMNKPFNNICPSNAAATSSYTYTTVTTGSGTHYRLASVTDPANGVWNFVNTGTTVGFVRAGESTPWLTNTIQERMNDDGLIQDIVNSQSFADGTGYTYGYDETPSVPGHLSSIAGGSYAQTSSDGHSRTTIVRYDFPQKPRPSGGFGNVGDDGGLADIVWQVTPGPVEVTDPLGRITTYDYCDPSAKANLPGEIDCVVTPMAVSMATPEGIRTNMTWDYATRTLLQTRQIARPGGTFAPGTSSNDLIRSATYNCTPANFRFCSKPVTITDARSHTTNLTYSADHGGILTETFREPSSGATRPETRYEYAQRYAWVSNGAGGYVQSATPVWLLVRQRLCRTSAASGSTCSGGAADEVIIDYDYGPNSGPNNLMLRGKTVASVDGGVTTVLRTCYGNDALGRRISETQPNANLTSCP
jgi:hypothetical protein